MIYTVTFNPSIDYILNIEKINCGVTNRSANEEIYPGGKGLNVSMVLSALGVENKAIAFASGFTGEYIESRMTDVGCDCDFIKLQDGFSRINVKIRSEEETEINANGPHIADCEVEELMKKISNLENSDILVLAGSIPSTISQDIYSQIAKMLDGKGVKLVVDSTKESLLGVLKYKPFLIKPNLQELCELFGEEIKSEEEIVEYANKLIDMGAQNVLVSSGGDIAILISQNKEVLKMQPPKGKLINSVGAGDSMVAGFLAGYIASGNLKEAFKLAVCTGSATAYKSWLAGKAEVEKLLGEIEC